MSNLPVWESTHRRAGHTTGDEYDIFTAWRNMYCYTQRPGVTKSIKRRFNAKRRREARESLREELKRLDR